MPTVLPGKSRGASARRSCARPSLPLSPDPHPRTRAFGSKECTMTTVTASGATLRPARSTDLPAIERLLSDSSLPLAGVAEALDAFTVAEDGKEIVGVAGLELCRGNALLRSVAITPEWRSRGLGRSLLTHVIADAESRGLRALYLLTTTADQYFPSF